MRKLATIRKILDIQPIANADNIELAIVDGWKVVVAKSANHKVGDLVVYCEIDSLLPIQPEFEFLRKSSYTKMSGGTEGFRLKTIKLRGQISQGLIISIKDAYNVFKRNYPNLSVGNEWVEGVDVSNLLNIVKYEKPIPPQLSGKVKGDFPSFITKTDEQRVQNLAEQYQQWKNNSQSYQFYVTEKLDGSSATFYINNGEFGVCSRNWELCEDGVNSFWKFAQSRDLKTKMQSLNINIAIQGELIGEGIQGNRYKLIGHDVRFFNAIDIDNRTKFTYDQFIEIVDNLGLKTVPIIHQPETFDLPDNIDDMLEFADGKSALNRLADREGIVVRSRDNSCSFKVISNAFLVKGHD